MALSTVPSSSGAVKSVQRGTAVTSGDITISAVDTSKTFVRSFSTGASGTVSISGTTLSAPTGTTSGGAFGSQTVYGSGYALGSGNAANQYAGSYGYTGTTRYGGAFYATAYVYAPLSTSYQYLYPANTQAVNALNFTLNQQTLSGGSTALAAAVNGAYLKNSTTITVTGPCRYEVIEHY